MSAYFVMIREQTTDTAALAEYGPKASLAAQGHPLKPLALYGALEQLEGDAVEGAVIIEFPDMDAARAWYNSPSYRQPSNSAIRDQGRKPSSSKAYELIAAVHFAEASRDQVNQTFASVNTPKG